jgi:hypothetical protein
MWGTESLPMQRRTSPVADLGCSPSAAFAYDYLVSRGLRDFQAAAIVGNLQLESRLDPRLEAMDTNNKISRGIAMWQPPRWQNLLTFAAGRDPKALDTQLDFLWAELQSGGYGLQDLLATTTLEDATVVFQNRFENPKQSLAHTDDRIKYARAAVFACPAVRPPPSPRGGTLIATASVVALVAAVGYGTYKILSTREREREPEIGPEPPPVFRPAYRPGL